MDVFLQKELHFYRNFTIDKNLIYGFDSTLSLVLKFKNCIRVQVLMYFFILFSK